jgi:hypothetical protein
MQGGGAVGYQYPFRFGISTVCATHWAFPERRVSRPGSLRNSESRRDSAAMAGLAAIRDFLLIKVDGPHLARIRDFPMAAPVGGIAVPRVARSADAVCAPPIHSDSRDLGGHDHRRAREAAWMGRADTGPVPDPVGTLMPD